MHNTDKGLYFYLFIQNMKSVNCQHQEWLFKSVVYIQLLPAISFWDLNPPGGCLRHEIGTVPSFELCWLFVVWSETPPTLDDGLVADLANAEFVVVVL